MTAAQPGILALWLDLAPEAELEVNEWFNREHHAERIGVPGFLAARRYVAERGAPNYFIFYRTRDLGVLTAPAYLERLNHPTPWTRRAMPHFRGTSRSACRELARLGRGEGGMVATLRFGAATGAEARLERWLCDTALPAALGSTGIVSAELWRADRSGEQSRHRRAPDARRPRCARRPGRCPERQSRCTARNRLRRAHYPRPRRQRRHRARDRHLPAAVRPRRCSVDSREVRARLPVVQRRRAGAMAKREGCGADHRVPDPGAYSLRFRHLRPWQRRPAGCPLRCPRPDPPDVAAPRAGRGPHGRCLLPGAPPAGRDADLLRARLLQPGDGARGGAVQLLGAARDHRQRPDRAVQPRPVPGAQPALSGRLPERAPARGQAQLPAEPGRDAALVPAPGDHHHARRPARPGPAGRALQPVPGERRRGARAALARLSGAAQRRLARTTSSARSI